MLTRSPPAESRRGNPARRVGEKFTFDEFVAVAENRLPLEAVRGIARGEAIESSTLFLVGPRGSGKTHLLRAAANEHNSQRTHELTRSGGVAVTGKRFVSELADAIDTRSTDELQSRYRSARLLLVDDVDALAQKSWAQEELIWTLEAIDEAGGRAMFTSRFWPAESSLEPRLVSRLGDAIVFELEHPGVESREELIRRLTRGKPVAWTAAAITAAARQLQGGVEAIRDAVADISSRAASRRAEQGAAVVDEADVREIASSATATPRLSNIVRQTARWFQLSADELRGPSRRRSVATARAVAMYLARELTGKSYQQIGVYFSDRDHSTVMHSCRRTAELIASQAEIRLAVSQLTSDLASSAS